MWIFMDDNTDHSCWSITFKAVLGFVAVLALTWLAAGSDQASVLASAAG
jgi:hypothetical protein